MPGMVSPVPGPCGTEWKHLPQSYSALFMKETVGSDQVPLLQAVQLSSDEVELAGVYLNP